MTVKDIAGQAKLIKPLVSKPYLPTEVENLTDVGSPSVSLKDMANAEIVGQQPLGVSDIVDNSPKEEETPMIYSTVIHKKPTSISRPIPVLQRSVKINAQNQVMQPGSFAIPVTIGNGPKNLPLTSNYVRPQFDRASSALPPEGFEKGREFSAESTLKNDFIALARRLEEEDAPKVISNAIDQINKEIEYLSQELEKEKLEKEQTEALGVKMGEMLNRLESVFKPKKE